MYSQIWNADNESLKRCTNDLDLKHYNSKSFGDVFVSYTSVRLNFSKAVISPLDTYLTNDREKIDSAKGNSKTIISSSQWIIRMRPFVAF